MAKLTLKHLDHRQMKTRRKRDGKLVVRDYYYFRKPGHPRIRIKGEAMSPEFLGHLARLEAGSVAPTSLERVKERSFQDLVARYKKSARFIRLKPRTQKDYIRFMDILLTNLDDVQVADIELQNIYEIQEKYEATARTANQVVAMLRVLMKFAVTRGWIKVNPAVDLEMLEEGPGWKAWTNEDVTRFLQSAPPVTMRRALMLALFTGQRRADVLKMRWDDYDGTYITVVQNKSRSKTPEPLYIPVHRDLTAELKLIPKRTIRKRKKTADLIIHHDTILVSARALPWGDGSNFAHEFRKACDKAGLPDLSMHGLRKLATTRLLDAGCTIEEVMAITGHKTYDMVRHYDKQASKKPRADAAILKLERKGK